MLATMVFGAVVLCLGDSITAIEDSWCSQSTHETVNIAIGGSTTQRWAGWLVKGRALPKLKQRKFDVVHILLGGNDVVAGRDDREYAGDIRLLVKHLRQAGVRDVVLSTPGYFAAVVPDHEAKNRMVDRYAAQIGGICKKERIVRCGVDLRSMDGSLFDSRLHPSKKGSAQIAAELDPLFSAGRIAPRTDRPKREPIPPRN